MDVHALHVTLSWQVKVQVMLTCKYCKLFQAESPSKHGHNAGRVGFQLPDAASKKVPNFVKALDAKVGFFLWQDWRC